MSQPLIKAHQRMLKSPSPITKEDYQKKKLKNWLKMLKNTKSKTRKLEKKSKLKMAWKAIVSMLSMLSMTRNSKERLLKRTREML